MTKKWDTIWVNCKIATFESDIDVISDGIIAVKDGRIDFVSEKKNLEASPEALAQTVHNLDGRLVTPGFIDCHTHLVYGGNRIQEFEDRLKGIDYQTIAKRGGGIQSTVFATRKANYQTLFHESLKRARAIRSSGVTILEIKSGYGLDLATEKKQLEIAKKIGEELSLTVCKTFLGAHAVLPEWKDNPDAYIELVCKKMMPALIEDHLIDAVDVFCEGIAFNLKQTEKVFQTAANYDLPVKCHADQLSRMGASSLSAQYKALSVDHLEYASIDDIKAMAESGSVAVLLPGAFYFLNEKQLPPIKALRQHKVPIALATDCNPGTSPILSILTILNMACVLFKLTPEEALLGATKHAARALGLAHAYGTLTKGKWADLAIWDAASPQELTYYIDGQPLHSLVKHGQVLDLSQ